VVGDGAEVARNLPSGTQVEGPVLDRAAVQDMLGHLPSPEREVLSRHYLDGMSLSAISVLLEVTESWVSQVHRSALRRLRCLYQAEAEAS
jgi:RNA polymerase sigma factor (sigma-70 family)